MQETNAAKYGLVHAEHTIRSLLNIQRHHMHCPPKVGTIVATPSRNPKANMCLISSRWQAHSCASWTCRGFKPMCHSIYMVHEFHALINDNFSGRDMLAIFATLLQSYMVLFPSYSPFFFSYGTWFRPAFAFALYMVLHACFVSTYLPTRLIGADERPATEQKMYSVYAFVSF